MPQIFPPKILSMVPTVRFVSDPAECKDSCSPLNLAPNWLHSHFLGVAFWRNTSYPPPPAREVAYDVMSFILKCLPSLSNKLEDF